MTTMQAETPSTSSGQALLLDALRRNLSLLGELAVRHEADTRPQPKADLPNISHADDVYRLVGREMAALSQEQMRVLLLDWRNNVIGQRVVYQGNIYSVVLRTAEVLRPAVIESAPQIIVVHNHPTGNPEPSAQDIAVTKDIAQAGSLLGIELLDHVVIGGDGAVSLKDRGQVPG